MKKILHIACCLILLAGGMVGVPAKSFATGQDGDILVVGSDTLELLAWPLLADSILWDKTWEWMNKCEHRYRRSNRSYIVVWKIENKQLYLDEIRGDGDYRMPIDSLFKSYYNAEGKIPASWVTEDLRATHDRRPIFSINLGFRRHYANEILFRVRQGRVLETIPYQNSFRKGDYPPMESCIKIVQGFDGSKFPELEGKRLIAVKMTVYPTAALIPSPSLTKSATTGNSSKFPPNKPADTPRNSGGTPTAFDGTRSYCEGSSSLSLHTTSHCIQFPKK